MNKFSCKCGSKKVFIKSQGIHKGLYCAKCGKWIKWLGKDELRLAEYQINHSNNKLHTKNRQKQDITSIKDGIIEHCIQLVNKDMINDLKLDELSLDDTMSVHDVAEAVSNLLGDLINLKNDRWE